MNTLKKIVYNCKQATFLIEKQQFTRLTIRERLELRIHLYGCNICKIFRKQSIVINRVIKLVLGDPAGNKRELDESFKKGLQERIEKELDKNQ